MFYFDAAEKPQISDIGDPYGNRTRVSAVERESPVILTLFPQNHALFVSCNINDLAGLGEISLPMASAKFASGTDRPVILPHNFHERF